MSEPLTTSGTDTPAPGAWDTEEEKMFNKAILIGRLGKDPDLSYTQSGTARCRFSMATSESYKDNQTGERKEKTTWHNVVVWGNQAENVDKYLHKGSLVSVEGKIDNRSYEKDGQTRYITEIVAQRVVFLDTKSDGDRQNGGGGGDYRGGDNQGGLQSGGGRGETSYQEDDIPF
jgi:single-strand DNA-binding protein